MRYLIYASILFAFSCTQQPTETADPFPRVESRNLGNKFKAFFNSIGDASKTTLETEPNNTEALANLAEANMTNWLFGFSGRDETMPEAVNAITKALSIDSTSANVHTVMGIAQMCNYEWKEAENSFLKAIELDSNDAKPRHWYALYLSAMGKFDKALASSKKAIDLDPTVGYNVGKGAVLYFANRAEDLKAQMKYTTSMDTTIAWGYDWLGMAHIELKEYDQSIATYRKAVALSDGTAEVMAGLGHALGLAGETEEAKEIAEYMAWRADSTHIPPVQRAYVHFSIGDTDGALDLLEVAYEQQAWELAFMQQEPWFDHVRSNVRFKAIIEKMNFPE